MDDSLVLKKKLSEKMSNTQAAQHRWVLLTIFVLLLFGLSVLLFITPVAELYTQRNLDTQHINIGQTPNYHSIEFSAVPTLYEFHLEMTMDTEADKNMENWAYIFVFKEEPEYFFTSEIAADIDMQTEDANDYREKLNAFLEYLDENAVRWIRLNMKDPTHKFTISWGDCDVLKFHIVTYNPKNPDTIGTHRGQTASYVSMMTYYEPTLPLIPLFFLISVIVVPLAIIRTYVLQQRKKDLRIQLSLDLDRLSDEDRVRLGIPVANKAPPTSQGQPPGAPASVVHTVPGQFGAAPRTQPAPAAAPPQPQPAQGPSRVGYLTPDEV